MSLIESPKSIASKSITPKFTAIFEECLEGGFTATVAEIPEIITQGDTMEEAQENLLAAFCDYASFLQFKKRQSMEQEASSLKRIFKPLHISIA